MPFRKSLMVIMQIFIKGLICGSEEELLEVCLNHRNKQFVANYIANSLTSEEATSCAGKDALLLSLSHTNTHVNPDTTTYTSHSLPLTCNLHRGAEKTCSFSAHQSISANFAEHSAKSTRCSSSSLAFLGCTRIHKFAHSAIQAEHSARKRNKTNPPCTLSNS